MAKSQEDGITILLAPQELDNSTELRYFTKHEWECMFDPG